MKLTRREALLGAAATVLSLPIPAAHAANAWQARHGMTTQQFQSIFDDLVSQGYRMTHTDGYGVNGSPLFAAIWEQRDGPAWMAHDNMTSQHYQRQFDRLVGQGYRLTKVSGYDVQGEALYAAIWTKDEGPAFVARHGLDSGAFQNVFDSLVNQGYRMTRVSGYAPGGQTRYAAIFEKTEGPAWFARSGLTSDEYQAQFDRATADGFRPRCLCGYAVGDTPNFAAIWDRSDGPGWEARHNMTSAQYQANFNRFTRRGMRLADVSGYAAGGQDLYAALWVGA